jgi:formylglycine-generating enzyme required for sulfatase activity
MYTNGVINRRILPVLMAALCLVLASQVSAQTSTSLAIQTYAGLTITGAVTTVYSIQYVTDVTQTNNASSWRCLEFLRLPVSPYLWIDKSGPSTSKRFYRAVVFAPTNFVFIPPGTFRMGSPTNEIDRYGDEGPQVDVTISRGFWMGNYEVSQGEYLAVMGTNPSFFKGDLSRPVEMVSRADATNYCWTLTQGERAAGRIPVNCVYRLPSEAEWEYACRASTSDRRFSYGDDTGYTNLTDYAWYYDNSGSTTHPVGQKLPNPWGLYDMYGNVFEWCQDWYGPYPGGSSVDPQGPAKPTLDKAGVARGGSWGFAFPALPTPSGAYSRSAFRLSMSAADINRQADNGFRVVLAPGQ